MRPPARSTSASNAATSPVRARSTSATDTRPDVAVPELRSAAPTVAFSRSTSQRAVTGETQPDRRARLAVESVVIAVASLRGWQTETERVAQPFDATALVIQRVAEIRPDCCHLVPSGVGVRQASIEGRHLPGSHLGIDDEIAERRRHREAAESRREFFLDVRVPVRNRAHLLEGPRRVELTRQLRQTGVERACEGEIPGADIQR